MKIFNGKIQTVIMSIICILVVASTWVFNLGWLRVFMTVVLIPHIALFVFMNLYSAKYFDKSKKIKMLNIFFVLTFIIAYVFMPDADDISSYAFFGLLHEEKILNILEFVSTITFISHIVTFIMQIVAIKRIKKTF